jgi:hypothetical protein
MATTLPASSRNSRDPRPRAALQRGPSGRSRPPRNDPSTITSPAARPRTQISPGARRTITATKTTPHHQRSPPRLTEAPGSDKREGSGLVAAFDLKTHPPDIASFEVGRVRVTLRRVGRQRWQRASRRRACGSRRVIDHACGSWLRDHQRSALKKLTPRDREGSAFRSPYRPRYLFYASLVQP